MEVSDLFECLKYVFNYSVARSLQRQLQRVYGMAVVSLVKIKWNLFLFFSDYVMSVVSEENKHFITSRV